MNAVNHHQYFIINQAPNQLGRKHSDFFTFLLKTSEVSGLLSLRGVDSVAGDCLSCSTLPEH
eukprot:1056899-Amphidinium_carterae.1